MKVTIQPVGLHNYTISRSVHTKNETNTQEVICIFSYLIIKYFARRATHINLSKYVYILC